MSTKDKSQLKKEYTYTKLADCNVGYDDLYHFYAVIVDASFPHKSFKSDRFICTIKIVDPSCNIDHEGVAEHCTLVLFAKKFEDLPISQRIGDIIRVHRANCGIYKGVKQFTANIFFNSSWALFSPYMWKDIKRDEQQLKQEEEKKEATEVKSVKEQKEYHPFQYYGKTFTFEKSEQKIIQSYREWIKNIFAKHQMLSNRYITELKDVPEQGQKRENGRYYDIDMQVKVLQLFKIDDYSSEIRVIDQSNEIWFSQILNMKFRWLREGQYVRIRAATLEHHDKYDKTFGLKNYSNILSLPYPSLIAKNMKIDDKNAKKQVDRNLLLQDGNILHPVIVSHITNQKYQQLPLRSLEYLLDQQKVNARAVLRTRFSVSLVNPQVTDKLDSFVKIQNKKTNAIRDSTSKGALKADERYVFYCQFYVQDYSNFLSSQYVRVLVCETNDDKKNGFFGDIKAEDIIKKKNVQEKVKETLNNLMRFNVWVEAALEISDNGYFILRDTELIEY